MNLSSEAVIARLDERDMLEIVDWHATALGVTREEVCGRAREKWPSFARANVMRELRHRHGLSLSEIGRLFGRNHTSVLHAVSDERRAKSKARSAAAWAAKKGAL